MTYCPSCGKPVQDGAAFCPHCGSAVPAPAAPEYAPAPGYGAAGYVPQPAPEAKHAGRMKKLLLILIPAAVVIAAGIALFLILGKGLLAGGGEDYLGMRRAIRAYIDEDENAYLPYSDGSCMKIEDPDGIEDAYLTPDGKHAVVLTREGELYLTDRKQAKKETLKKNVALVSMYTDLGFFFQTDDGKYYRYSFREGSAVKLADKEDGYRDYLAEDGIGQLYVWDNKLYRFPAGAQEPEKVASSENEIVPIYLSDDGKTVIWAEETDTEEYTVMLLEGETKSKLGKLRGEYCNPSITLSKDRKLGVIRNRYPADSILIWQKGREAARVKINAERMSIFTAYGPMLNVSASSLEGFYAYADTNDGKNILYYVTLDGEKEKLLSGVQAWTVSGGWILWTDREGVLHGGKLKGAEITEERELDEDVDQLVPSGRGKYFYYLKDVSDEAGTLCGYRAGDKAPVRIDSEVNDQWPYSLKISTGGDTVYYVKDAEEYEYSADEYSGTLVSWTWGGERKKIADDVYLCTGTNACKSNMWYYLYYYVDPRSIWFMTDVEEEYGDLYFWNGKEKTKLASGVYADFDY